MDITDGQHQNQIDYILCSQRWRSSIQSAKTRQGADCGSDHELLIVKFRLKLNKVGKTRSLQTGDRRVRPRMALEYKMKQGKANRVLPREHTGHSKHPLPTTQEKTLHMDITRWSTPNQIDYILCSQRWRSSIQSAKTRPGADCGSDHELLIAKCRLKLKKVGKPLDHSGMT